MEDENVGRTKAFLLSAAVLSVLWAACSPAEEDHGAPDRSSFIRFVEDGPWQGRLQTAVVSYEDPEGVRVDLVAAVHLADPEYYRTLQGLFSIYDAVLYELVAPEGTRPRAGMEGEDNLVSRLQRGLCRALGLSFQLRGIDYSRPNFVHADLSPRDLAEIWEEKGESIFSVVLRVLRAQFAAAGGGAGRSLSPEALLEALRDPRWKQRVKYLVARELTGQMDFLSALDGEEGQDPFILTGERNKAVVAVLRREMKRGKRRIAVFYGAGHMKDLERRIERAFGFRRRAGEWITAWKIPAEAPGRRRGD